MSRNIRTFSTLGRSLFKVPTSARNNGPINVQHVRFVKPAFNSARFQRITISLTLAWLIWNKLEQIDDIDQEHEETKAEHIKEAVQQVKVSTETERVGPSSVEGGQVESDGTQLVVGSEEDDEFDEDELVPEEQPEDAWFIPLGLAKQVPRTFYKGSDPEWQSFIEFAKDKQRGTKVKNELAGLAGFHVAKLNYFQKFLGMPITTGKYWLDIDFPDGPPPEYERAGLEITDDYIAYTVRPVDAVNVSRLRNALWPLATGSSLWASCSMFAKLQAAKVRKALNLEQPKSMDNGQSENGYTDLEQLLEPNKTGVQSKGAANGDAQIKPPSMISSTSKSGSEDLESGKPWILRPLPAVPKPNTEISKASTAFRHNLAKNWKSASAPPPRGSFVISGLVEVYGPKGICTLDVRGAYDPIESQWMVVSLSVRRLQQRRQKPRG